MRVQFMHKSSLAQDSSQTGSTKREGTMRADGLGTPHARSGNDFLPGLLAVPTADTRSELARGKLEQRCWNENERRNLGRTRLGWT
jgi:hypothetical protein